jgi:hypothetical protein
MRLIGAIAAGEILETAELNDAFVSLNQMLFSWNSEGASLYARKRGLIPMQPNVNIYVLQERPIRIESASVTVQGIDCPLEIVDSTGWEAITEKGQLAIIARKLFCDYLYPAASVYIWPSPRLGATLEIWIYGAIAGFSSLDQAINLPDGYEAGLRWNLALNLAPEYGRPIDQAVAALAQNFKASLVQLNAQNHMKSQAATASFAQQGVTQ